MWLLLADIYTRKGNEISREMHKNTDVGSDDVDDVYMSR